MNLDVVSTPMRSRPGLDAMFRRLRDVSDLTSDERSLLVEAIGPVEVFAAGRDLISEAPGAGRAGVVVSGWACRQRLLPDGRRQIFDFLLPGDVIGIARTAGPLSATWTVCVTKVGFADGEPFRRLLLEQPDRCEGIDRALRGLVAREEKRLLDQVMRLGRYSAYERVGHFLLELADRLGRVSMLDGASFPMPLTQETLADALGLSVVHVNRVIQQLKRDQMIELRAGRCTLLDPALLTRVCDFSPAATTAAA
jgi:CRP-like cAMP-binding protein